jgi:hypothetical protein
MKTLIFLFLLPLLAPATAFCQIKTAPAQATASSLTQQQPPASTVAPIKVNSDSILKAKVNAILKARTDSLTKATMAITETTVNQVTTAPSADKNPWAFWTGWCAILLIISFFIWLAAKRDLLRDPVTDIDAFMAAAHQTARYQNATDPSQVKKPFSLSRSQLGVWLIVISCSYIYMAFCRTCQFQGISIDSTLLSLMGISAGTAAAGGMIDTGNNQVPHHQDGPSEGFFTDILSDQNGISIHRFQNVVWTMIAIVIYLWQIPTLHCGQLPVLDHTLVALTGISSLTYLGLKVNENKPPMPPVARGGNPDPLPAPDVKPATVN